MKLIEFFEGHRMDGKKDSTTSLNVGVQFLDEGFYENIRFFSKDLIDRFRRTCSSTNSFRFYVNL
jgi:hypothetical protein